MENRKPPTSMVMARNSWREEKGIQCYIPPPEPETQTGTIQLWEAKEQKATFFTRNIGKLNNSTRKIRQLSAGKFSANIRKEFYDVVARKHKTRDINSCGEFFFQTTFFFFPIAIPVVMPLELREIHPRAEIFHVDCISNSIPPKNFSRTSHTPMNHPPKYFLFSGYNTIFSILQFLHGNWGAKNLFIDFSLSLR